MEGSSDRNEGLLDGPSHVGSHADLSKQIRRPSMGLPQTGEQNDDHELRVLLPSKLAGAIIGRAGRNISKLRTEYKAAINMPDCDGPERVISIITENQQTTLAVLKKVVLLSKNLLETEWDDAEVVDVEVRVLLHQHRIGSIIGKAGATIGHLRQSTNCRIRVYGCPCPGSTDRIISVSASLSKVMLAIEQILVIAYQAPLPYLLQEQYDPHNFDLSLYDKYGGYGHEDNEPVKRSSRYSMPRGHEENTSRSGGGKTKGSGPSRRVGPYWCGRGEELKFDRKRSDRNDDDNQEGKIITTQVTIPKECAGAIIGRGGCRIRNTRSLSEASITIGEGDGNDSDRIITITGTQSQISHAQHLMRTDVLANGFR